MVTDHIAWLSSHLILLLLVDDDDMIIMLLRLAAACDLPVNRMPSIRESLTVDEVRKGSVKIWCKALLLQHLLSSPFRTLTANVMILTSNCKQG